MKCELTDDVEVFLAATTEFLESRPVEHNLVLSLAEVNRAEPLPSRWAWVSESDGDRVVGVLVQTPATYPASVTPMPPTAVEALVDRLSQDAPDMPGMNGEAGTVARFAGAWATARCIPVRPEAGQRIYELGRLKEPDGVEGRLRQASASDVDRLVAWDEAFAAETGLRRLAGEDHRTRIAHRARDGRFWVWDLDGEPVSMAYTTPNLAGAARIGAVYTPPEQRAKGYAGACVGRVSAQLLASGVRNCLPYTQLANPFSNRLYHRLGYRPVTEILVYRFG